MNGPARRGAAAGLVLAVLLSGCVIDTTTPESDLNADSADALEQSPDAGTPEARLSAVLALIYADSPYAGQLSYKSAFVDLNDDGQTDAVAYVQGPNGCAEGCDLFVFQGRDKRFSALNRLPLARPPLTRADSDSGWADLVTQAAAPSGQSSSAQRLVFGGTAYQPAERTATSVQSQVLIEDMDSAQPVPTPNTAD
ncbi:hypothetical protein [Salinisphaera japonica]|uniref:Lipoprotein n=1 Tax=Salinisphaera japonica YTM-1 TaxID=1209778 RepID=A0A423PP29_9GAMM|nr:hypothetical protein [Salinisphaera japonica]ROO27333.1 hypothetical protein SAJA_09590 [Salinisphaera japonica YTM-1]